MPDKTTHVETALKQELDGVASDETRATGDENFRDSEFLSKSNGFVDFRCLLKYIQKTFD
jgi:hypothetical protein